MRFEGQMKKSAELSRRRPILSDTFALENRELLSSFGRSTLALAAADIDSFHLAIDPSNHPEAVVAFPTVKRWSWLDNTYWYVPPANLPAVLYNSSTGTVVPVNDQTVYHISTYKNGYFWGQSATQLGSSQPSYSTMLGSVTPEGRILLTFTATSNNTSPSITEGFGEMQRKRAQWTMENQMFTAPNETLQIGHWAYMVQTRPGLPSWKSLPSAGVSVPAFLAQA
jgi:hypothetical protein